MNKQPLKFILLAILACFLWSTAAAGIKIGLAYCTPLLFAGLRFLLAGSILIPFVRGGFSCYREILKKHFKILILVSLFQTILLYLLFFEGMALVPSATGSIINGSGPLVAAVLSHCFCREDKLKISKTFKILCGFAGVVFITISREPFTAHGVKELAGSILVFASCICSATGNIIISATKEKIDPVPFNSLQISIGGMVLVILSLFFEGAPVLRFTPVFIVVLLWLALVSAVGFSIWFYLLKQDGVKVSELNFWKFLIPVFGVFVSWLFVPGESPQWTTVVGMTVVAGSILLLFYKGKRVYPG